jgi:Spy/CpxP family protein refolding chaperone
MFPNISMKKQLTAVTLGLCLPLAALAENAAPTAETPSPVVSPAPEAGKHHGIKLKQLSEELGLSEAQESKIKALFKKHKQKIKEIREERKDENKEALTPEEKLKLSRLKEKNEGKIKALRQAVKEEEIKP